ncbi:lasso peptide biosynthesis B2 protein [Caulobacter sp. S45]|uniref:lasso peptide biosynthesis B2 protein n=1 Tax=Caulobacter sp. S45 TaxID=1641861 RepID=UPI00131B3A3F|nr:lasso peptide biosynthesis B2 protein [Caulobacter sp. S45]
MELQLSDRYAATDVDGDVVFLDRRDFTFHMLPGAGTALSAGSSNLVWQVTDSELAGTLIEAGIFATAPWQVRTKARRVENANRNLPRTEHRPPTRTERADLALAGLSMCRHFPGRNFQHLLEVAAEHLQPLDRLASEPPSSALIDSVAMFLQIYPWIPFQGACLFRSLMLLLYLRRQGHDAMWVFGVRTWPFLAHCWLQVGDVVLNDHAEGLVSFYPILVA